jgi:hypothetical protein
MLIGECRLKKETDFIPRILQKNIHVLSSQKAEFIIETGSTPNYYSAVKG